MTRAMERRHASGHERRPIRHADRRGDVEVIESSAGCGEAINVGRLYNRIAVTTEVIGPMLIRDDQEKIRSIVHNLVLRGSRLSHWSVDAMHL